VRAGGPNEQYVLTGDAALPVHRPNRRAEAEGDSMPVEQVNGTPIAYEMTGEGEPLVLVHGAWVDGHTWDLVVPQLAESYFVVTYDLRGHGRSVIDPPGAGSVHDDVADLAALIERLEIGSANVAGISSGACIALRLTIERPELVRRTLAHEPPMDGLLAADPDMNAMLEEYLESIAAVRELVETGAHRAAAARFMDTVAIGPGTWSLLPPPVQDTFVRHAPAFLGQLNDPDALELDLDALGDVSTPLLLSQGDQSPPIFLPIMEQLGVNTPKAERRTLANTGHVPHMTNPDDYVSMITGFIQT
jgi:pimeloyl-ACP methyl ester carboxylesterase